MSDADVLTVALDAVTGWMASAAPRGAGGGTL
jgi:hypothetical protein